MLASAVNSVVCGVKVVPPGYLALLENLYSSIYQTAAPPSEDPICTVSQLSTSVLSEKLKVETPST